jgi:2-polyprenyl-6-methoxyphenol hydroxylase-like FAD-dependent oxidoreductase
MPSHRVGIVGAGTAGLASAIAFARAGHAVEVFEKHPGLAALGAGVLIQPQGVAALHDLGVGPAFAAASVPIERLLGLSERGWKLVDISYADLRARAVSRTVLGGVLLRECARLGVTLRFGSGVDAVLAQDGASAGAAIVTSGGARHAFDMAVIANGATSKLPAACGLALRAAPYRWGALWSLIDLEDWPDPQLLGQRYGGTERMAGIMPTERLDDGRLRVSLFWSLRRDRYEAWRAAPLADWKRELLSLWPESAPVVERIHAHEQLAFAAYCHARPRRLAAGPVCIVGDAAHAMSPQLGLGSTLAVQDALALAVHVGQAGPVEGLRRYSRARLATVRAYQALSRALTPCFQADGKGLWRDLMFAGALRVPGTRWLMHRSIAAPRRCVRGAWTVDPAGQA